MLPVLLTSLGLQVGALHAAAGTARSTEIKCVQSWYDAGARLASTAAPTAEASREWPALGGSGAWHPMRGPWPKAPARELWSPPSDSVTITAAACSPTVTVQSWYDAGERLEQPVEEEVPDVVGTVQPVSMNDLISAAPAPAGFEWGATF